MTDRVKEILSWYEADNPGTLTNLARIMNRTPRSPRPQRHRQTAVQTGDPRRLHQQPPARRADQRLATGNYPNPLPSPATLHPRSAFPLGILRSSTTHRIPYGVGTSVPSTPRVANKTRRHMKRRG